MQVFINNFHATFLDPMPADAAPRQVRVTRDVGGTFDTPIPAGDFVLLTAFRVVNNRELEHEVLRVTAAVAQQGAYLLTVQRAQERVGNASAATAFEFGVGDHIEARWTAGAAQRAMQSDDNLRTIANPDAALGNLGVGPAGLALFKSSSVEEILALLGLGGLLAPVILVQPQSIQVNEGAAAVFSVTALGLAMSYQWRKGGVAIPGATSSSYVISAAALADGGSFDVVVSNFGGSVTSAAATLTVASAAVAPANTGAPAITGTAQVGNTLTSTTGTWTGTPTITYSRQWLRNGVAISGATATTYVPVTGDIGATISVRVTATNTAGNASATSSATAAVVAAPVVAPVNTVLPAITGTAQVGETLTVSNGTWSNSPTSYTRQWKRAGVDIAGATGATYSPVTGDIGSALTCTVTATNAGGSAAATSGATAAVIAAAAVTRPRVFYAPANSTGQASIFAAAWGEAVLMTGSSNAGRTGTFNTDAKSDTTLFPWVAVLMSAVGSGIRFFDGTGYGGYSGAQNTGVRLDGDPADPISIYHSWTAPDGNVYAMFRRNGKATAATTNNSIL